MPSNLDASTVLAPDLAPGVAPAALRDVFCGLDVDVGQRLARALLHRSFAIEGDESMISEKERASIHGLLLALYTSAIVGECSGEIDITDAGPEVFDRIHKLHLVGYDAECRIAHYAGVIDPLALARFLDGLDLSALAADDPEPGAGLN